MKGTPNTCDPMADPCNRERLAIKILMEIRAIATQLDHCDREKIVPRIDDLFDQCGYTLIAPTKE